MWGQPWRTYRPGCKFALKYEMGPTLGGHKATFSFDIPSGAILSVI